ncbi:unnamed protein product [Callosobruchus maculatus]|uniref:Chitin-binding type-2 domain-containing protein n=1 Tax=Callosobruchus maculatus TaxID=64391 RepID=A0A653CP86_CALMS|nr:unnamed protein product [Callosobruchus maculatus]
MMNNGANWTLERDQDRAGPYIFSEDNWIAFDDATSLDIKSKYARVRGLAGIALKDVSQDASKDGCEGAVDTVYAALSAKGRAPRAALLHDLERELEGESTELHAGVRLSPYRITRVVDIEGKHHVIRQDTRTEFSCTRQGYFVHPRSCNRFYRCVKFDQTSEDYSVFEFECPAGLAFDERVEVCVWPGSLPEGQPCQGSAEIAPVPRQRFVCPHEQGYYADPENCRWFFACMDHGTSELTPYEFRCPYGLYFDSDRLVCEWPWLVPKCGQGREGFSEFTYGGGGPSLDQYDGLGSLGLVKLGGLSGHVDQPIVYSNVGAAQNGYNGGFGSLGYGATFALKNAGLLKEDHLDNAYQHNSGTTQQYSAGYADTSQSQYNQGSANSYNDRYNTLYHGTYLQANSGSGNNYGDKVTASGYSSNDNIRGQYESNLGNNVNNLLTYQNSANLKSFESQTGGALYDANSAFQNRGSQNYALGGAVSFHSLKQYHGQPSGAQYEANFATSADTSNRYQDNSDKHQTLGEGTFSSHSTNQHSAEAQGAQYTANLANSADNLVQYQSKGINVQGLGAYSTNQYYGQNTNAQYEANLANNIETLLKYENTAAQQSLGSSTTDASSASFGSGHTTAYQSTTVDAGGNAYQTGAGSGATSTQTFNRYYGNNRNVIGNTYNTEGLQQHEQVDFGHVAQKGATFGHAANVIVSKQENFGHGANSQFLDNYQHKNTLVDSLDTIDHNANLDYDTRQAYQHGVNGNINIVGGGYSSVGDATSGIEVSNNGETYVSVSQSTPAPVSVTTVTSVPLPSLKTYSGFESYNGGVIANIPELQYKVQGERGLRNVSYEIGSSTPAPILTSTDLHVNSGRFFSSLPVSTTARPFSVHTSSGDASSFGFQSTGAARYDTSSPAITYVSTTVSPSTYGSTGSSFHHDTYSAPSPGVTYVSTTQKPVVTIPISTHGTTVQTYESPAVSFVSTTPKPISTVSHHPASSVAFNGASVSSYKQFSPSATPSTITVEKSAENQVAYGLQTDELYGGYNYERPSVTFNEVSEGVAYSTPKPTPSTAVTPVYISKNVDTAFGGYHYKQPTVKFEETPSYVTVSTPKSIFLSSTVQPTVYYASKSSDSFSGYHYESPRFEVSPQTGSVSKTKHFITTNVAPVAETSGYTYNKPTTAFEETPTTRVREETGYAYEKPSVAFEERPVFRSNIISKFTIRKPAIQYSSIGYNQGVVNANYHNVVNANSYQNIAQPGLASSYYYQKPVSRYSYKDVVQQAVSRPVFSTTVQPIEYTVQTTSRPAVVSSFFHQQPVSKYSYQDVLQQAVTKQSESYTTLAPEYVPTTKESPTYYYREPTVTEYNYPSTTYNYVTPSSVVSSYTASSSEKPAVLVQQQGYDYPRPTVDFVEEPRSTVTYVPSTTPAVNRVQTQFRGYTYQRPTIDFEETTTSRPYVTYENREPVKEEGFIKKTAYVTGEHFSSGISPVVATGDTPVVVENYQAFNYNKIRANANNYVQSTPKPTFISTVSSIASSKKPVTDSPNYYYHDSRLSSPTATSTYLPPTEEYLQGTSTPAYEPVRIPTTFKPRSKVTRTYLPPTREYLPSTTPEYEPVRTVAPVTTTYLPPTTYRARVTTQVPSTAYLPARISTTTYVPPSTRSRVRVTTQAPSSTYLPVEVTTLSRSYLPSRTVIKQNDIHPLLSAKLGAQCTCVTNALKSGRRQKIIVVDDDDDDGYIVDNGRTIENYEYDSRKVIDITPTPEVYAKNNRRPSGRVSDGEILNAVKTGLKLVKEAAREGAQEGVEKVLSRSRDSIECNRAGLFRHPSQCNKFYSCRWDCTKNKYTLHMFDCPIHLTFDSSLGACNWPSQGPACMENTLLPSE